MTALLLLGMAACQSLTVVNVSAESGEFWMLSGRGAISIRNLSTVPIYYLVIEEEAAATLDLNPNFRTWDMVPAGEIARIPHDSILGFERGDRRAVIPWSDLTRGGTVHVRLR